MKKENDKVIKNAFARLLKNRDTALLESLRAVMKSAMAYALELHKLDGMGLHLKIGDDYGWAIIHEGRILDYEVLALSNHAGTAKNRLLSLADTANPTSEGWVAILMAGMETAKYAEGYEAETLESVAKMTGPEFYKVFKKEYNQTGR